MNQYDQGKVDALNYAVKIVQDIMDGEVLASDGLDHIKRIRDTHLDEGEISFVTTDYFKPHGLPGPWQKLLYCTLKQLTAFIFASFAVDELSEFVGAPENPTPEIVHLLKRKETVTTDEVMQVLGPFVASSVVDEAVIEYNETILGRT